MNAKRSRRISVETVILIASLSVLAASDCTRTSAAPASYLKAEPEVVQRWRDMKFGMFIHWGPVSLKGTEIGWSRGGERRGHRTKRNPKGIPVEVYDNLYQQFNPVKFNANEWVQLAKDAGMKYLVFTTKHHDGFVNFDSKLTNYKITSPESPYGKDIVKQLADACHKGGLKLGFYYSPPDWHHPDYRTENHYRYIEYLHGQLHELCTNYGKVDIIWFDGLGGKAKDWDSENLFRMIRQLQPDVIINNRAGLSGDFDTPEQRIGKFQTDRPWETCMTIGRQWAWKPNDKLKSLKQCLQTLVRVVGGDGNFLFNVGPMPDGRIEPRQVERLREMGQWLTKYGESIYTTRGGPFKPGPWGASTYRDNCIYVHILDWRGDSLRLPAINKKIVSGTLLTGGKVTLKQTEDDIALTIPEQYHRDIDTIVKLELDGPAREIAPVSVVSAWPVRQTAAESKRQRDKRMKWWREARFGMFIHWGVYSVPAGTYKGEQIPGIGEWIMQKAKIPISEYEQFAQQFNPVKFDADEWVRIAKNAGMKYIVITSKHHDGFCLWDSKLTDYDIVDATPFKRDVLKELSEACKRHGIRLCFYHSIMDWHHPYAQAPFYPNYNDRQRSNPNFTRYVENYMKPQLKELITNYGPVGVLWFDGEWIKDWTEPQGKDMYNYVLSLQPDIIINNRVGKGRKGMQGMSKGKQYAGDFGTPEQQIPPTGLAGVDWETCMTMNNTWGYKSYDHNWKSTKDLLRKLADIASKGGNFLLNVGPTSEGLFPQPSVERLAAMGEWMAKNSESIYGTTASPLGKLSWGRCTAKPGKLYLHVFDWPTDGKLKVPLPKNKVKKAYLLAEKEHSELPVICIEKDKISIMVPNEVPDPINTVVAVEIKDD
ncbi:MAG: alpha-L-fucosidase [Sedimentisphaerales bacterium]